MQNYERNSGTCQNSPLLPPNDREEGGGSSGFQNLQENSTHSFQNQTINRSNQEEQARIGSVHHVTDHTNQEEDIRVSHHLTNQLRESGASFDATDPANLPGQNFSVIQDNIQHSSSDEFENNNSQQNFEPFGSDGFNQGKTFKKTWKEYFGISVRLSQETEITDQNFNIE